jgi:hypothetical protein
MFYLKCVLFFILFMDYLRTLSVFQPEYCRMVGNLVINTVICFRGVIVDGFWIG